MYAIYGKIYHQYTPNVSIYTMDPMGFETALWILKQEWWVVFSAPYFETQNVNGFWMLHDGQVSLVSLVVYQRLGVLQTETATLVAALWLKLKLEVADVPCIVPCPQDRKVRNHYLSGILLFYLFGGCYMYILSSHKTSNTVWWFESFFVFFHILGMSSSQLTFIFFGGVGIPPTRTCL